MGQLWLKEQEFVLMSNHHHIFYLLCGSRFLAPLSLLDRSSSVQIISTCAREHAGDGIEQMEHVNKLRCSLSELKAIVFRMEIL